VLTIGLIANVLSAWACAMWSQPTGSDAIWLAGVRREFFEKSPATYTSRPSDCLFVAYGYYGAGAQFLDIASDEPIKLLGPANHPNPRLDMVRAGWPWIAFEGWLERDASRILPAAFPPKYHFAIVDKKRMVRADRISMERMIPLHPLWPGLAMNWAFWAGAIWVVWFMVVMLRRLIRRWRRQCASCGYPVGVSAVCTECGRPIRTWLARGQEGRRA